MRDRFRAFVVEEHNGAHAGAVTEIGPERLPPGDVTIEVEFSSLNYKDALAARGLNKVAARYPHVPGIDAVGRVLESATAELKAGDPVLVTGFDLGAGVFGGYAEYIRVPADWVVPLPAGLSPFEAMALGTAGFTAAMALLAMERNGQRPDQGPILVTGATGGVGSLAVNILSGAGYTVAAATGKAEAHDFLRRLGAGQVLDRAAVTLDEPRPRPMLKSLWAGAVDTVGGPTLSYLIRSTQTHGNIAACGLVGGTEFAGTVIPFLLRGVNLLGIDSAFCPRPYRDEVWRRLATDLKPRRLGEIVHQIGLADLPNSIEAILQGRVQGRRVVGIKG